MASKSKMSDEEMLRRLGAHPQIRNRIASLLSAVDDTAGDLKLADDAELRLTHEPEYVNDFETPECINL